MRRQPGLTYGAGMTGEVTLADIERLLRRMAGEAARRDVDALLEAVRGHVEAHGVVCECLGVPERQKPVRGAVKAPRPPAPHMVTDPGETARICRVCAVIRPIEEFARTKNGTRGRRNACRLCENIRKNRAGDETGA